MMQEKSTKSSKVLLQYIFYLSTQSMAGQSSRISSIPSMKRQMTCVNLKHAGKKSTKREVRLRLVEKCLGSDLSQRLRLLIKAGYHQRLSPTKGQSGIKERQGAAPRLTQEIFFHKCRKQYKNIRSYINHMYQAHMKTVPEGSSHTLQGKPKVKAVPLQPNISSKLDQLKQPRQDQVLSFGPSHNLSKIIEEEPYELVVQCRTAKQTPTLKGGGPQFDPPKGRKTEI